ncbi:MAG: sensor histidine kinase [Acidimicrobiales bacterium]
MTLRARLTLVLFVLLAGGLLTSAVALRTVLRAELLRRVDAQLNEVASLGRAKLGPGSTEIKPVANLSDDKTAAEGNVQVARIDPGGTVVSRLVSPLAERPESLEAIPSQLLRDARPGHPRRANVSIHDHPYRVLVSRLPGSSDVLAVVAPLREVNATISHLQDIGLVVGLVLLALGSSGAWWLVGVGLRPLEDMVQTADAIASGEVDRRVPVEGSRSPEAAQLAQALNLAFDARQRSEEAMRQFVTDASHELRTPLTSIRGYAELHRQGALTDPQAVQRAISRIEGEAVRMGGLVDDLLALARIDQGRPLHLAPLDLVSVAVDAVADARASDPGRVVTVVAPEAVTVRGDEAQLHQVLVNLLTNARQHTPSTTDVEVAVRISGGDALIEVTDEGDGLPTGSEDRVFERFWRGEEARGRTRGRSGTGLGLSIVAAIVEAHGGWVRAENVASHGARFTVGLPLAGPEPAAADDGLRGLETSQAIHKDR